MIFGEKVLFIYTNMIGQRFNFEDVFFRDLTVCVLDTLEGQVKWINRFSSGDIFVNVPFYYSLSGDERFLLDSFADDIVSENRFVELNTDMIPRGHLTMTGFNIKSDEFANPNVWLRMVVENQIEIRKVLSKVRAVPITVNYDLEILLSSEIDTFKCSQAIMDTLWIYRFMYFEHNFLNIDAVLLMPDSNSIEMSREKNLTSDNNIKLKCSFTVETYYPAFRSDRVSGVGYPRKQGSGMSDTDGFNLYGGGYDANNFIGPDNFPFTDFNGVPVADSNGNPINGGISSFFPQPGGAGFGASNNFQGTPGSFDGSPGFGSSQNPSGNISGQGPAVPPGNGTVGGGPFGPRPYPPGFGAGSFGQSASSSGGQGSSYGLTGPFLNTEGAGSPSDPFGLFTTAEYFEISPRRTKWFNNILRYRDTANGINRNPNAGNVGQPNVGIINGPRNN